MCDSIFRIKRNEKVIGSSLQAGIKLYISSECQNLLKDINLAEMFIVSSVEVHDSSFKNENCLKYEDEGVFIEVLPAEGDKCNRCWTILPEVKDNLNNLCKRCDDVWQTFQ